MKAVAQVDEFSCSACPAGAISVVDAETGEQLSP